eukprot:Clim_evm41s231 gene=Clim_evmTU41s231
MAYFMKASGPRVDRSQMTYLPATFTDKTGATVVLDFYDAARDEEILYLIFKDIVEDGMTYPQETLDTIDEFRAYYCTHDVFVIRDGSSKGEAIGGFYVKPNFPGRSSHLCNAGFIVHKAQRRRGLARIMCHAYPKIAVDLDYEGSFFNLVYMCQPYAVPFYESMGFRVLSILPKAGRMKEFEQNGYSDAAQMYADFAVDFGTDLKAVDFGAWMKSMRRAS